MEEILVPLFAMIILFIVCPGMVMWFAERRRRERMQIDSTTGKADQQLVALAHKLERRVQALESILDSELPGWRRDMPASSQEKYNV